MGMSMRIWTKRKQQQETGEVRETGNHSEARGRDKNDLKKLNIEC